MYRHRKRIVLFALTALLGGGCAGTSHVRSSVVLAAKQSHSESPQIRSDRMSVESAAEALRASQGSSDRIQASIGLERAVEALATDFDPSSTDSLTAFRMGWAIGSLEAGATAITMGTTDGDTFLITAGYRSADEGMTVLGLIDEAAN